jgi:hypothetical protein
MTHPKSVSLPEFLNARLNEDEQVARATTGPWKYHHETHGVVLHTARHIPESREVVSTPREPSDALHIARHNSARVLREVHAKRRMMAEHPQVPSDREGIPDGEPTTGCGLCHTSSDGRTEPSGYCNTIKLLALPYADHKDYRAEWVA